MKSTRVWTDWVVAFIQGLQIYAAAVGVSIATGKDEATERERGAKSPARSFFVRWFLNPELIGCTWKGGKGIVEITPVNPTPVRRFWRDDAPLGSYSGPESPSGELPCLLVITWLCRQSVDVVRATISEASIRGGPYQKCRNSRRRALARHVPP